MTWDAIAALGVVAVAVALLVRQMRGEKQACAKCEVVKTQRRVQEAGVTKKRSSALRIGQLRKS